MENNLSVFNLVNFTPSDEILATQYLFAKAQGQQIFNVPMPDIDLYARVGLWDKIYEEIKDQNMLYCFAKLKKKTDRGSRIDRTAEFGTWKSQSDTKINFKDVMQCGSLRKFTFLVEQGIHMRDRWVMHEYRLDGCFENKANDYVLCRLIKRANKNAVQVNPTTTFLTPLNDLGFLPPIPCQTRELNSQSLETYLADKPDLDHRLKHVTAVMTPEENCQSAATLQNEEEDLQQLMNTLFSAVPVNPPTTYLTPLNELGFLPPTPCQTQELNLQNLERYWADKPDLDERLKRVAAFMTPGKTCQSAANEEEDLEQIVTDLFD